MLRFVTAVLLLLSSMQPVSAHKFGSDQNVMHIGVLTFSDSSGYNTADHAGSPLGLLETATSPFCAELGYAGLSWNSQDDTDYKGSTRIIQAPRLTVGQPGAALFQIYYEPRPQTTRTSALSEFSMMLHHFGFALAGGTSSGYFQAALEASGYYGSETQSLNDDLRAKMGVEELGIHVGSQVHPLARIGFFASATGSIDTLYSSNDFVQDRFFSGRIPVIGGFLDFGGDEMPLRSNFALGVAIERFLYVTKPSIQSGGNQNPIRGDSLYWDWQTMVDIDLPAKSRISPAFQIGYWRAANQVYAPTAKNDNPLQVGDIRTGDDWRFSSLRIGLGVSSSILEYLEAGIEYSYSNLGLVYGEQWPGSDDESRGYHGFRIATGALLHRIERLRLPKSMELSAKIGWLNFRHNSAADPWWGNDFSAFYSMGNGSQVNRYSPGATHGTDERINGFTFGIGAAFLDRMFSVDAGFGFFGRKDMQREWSGAGFGGAVSYALK